MIASSEHGLVRRIQAGDEAVFTKLYHRYVDRIYGYMRVTLGDAHDAEDGVQQVFMAVYRAVPRYDAIWPHPFEAWLFTIARNQAITMIRARRRVVPAEPVWVELELERRARPSNGGSLVSIDDARLVAEISRLPSAQRHVIALRYVLGLSTGDVAHAIGRDARAVRQLHHRALRSLEKRLVSNRQRPRDRASRMRRRAP